MSYDYGLGATIAVCSNPFMCPSSKPSVGPNYYDAYKPAPIAPKPTVTSAPVPVAPAPSVLPVKIASSTTPVLKGLSTGAPTPDVSGKASGGGQTTLAPFPTITALPTGGGAMSLAPGALPASADVELSASSDTSWLVPVGLGVLALMFLKSSKRKR